MPWAYLGIALFLLGGGAYGVYSYKSAVVRAETAEGRAREFAAAYDNLASALPRIQENANAEARLARARGDRASAAEQLADQLRRELDDAKNSDAAVADWAAVRVPDAIRLSVESLTARAAANVPRADGLADRNGRAQVPSGDERRSGAVHPEAGPGLAPVQR